MNTENWPNTVSCPICQTSHELDQGKAGCLAVCRKCGRSFHLLPGSGGDDTVISASVEGGESALPAVGRLWLDLRPGQIVAEKYLVVRPLGLGGLSRIFQVRDLDSDQILALKLPLPSTVERVSARALFDEARIWLKPAPHPNLVTCETVKIVMGLPAIFMEYVSGGDLAALMDQGSGRLYQGERYYVVSRIMDIFIQVIRGLVYAHSLGLSQLDIKPRNILVGRGGRVLISDYGPLHNIAREAFEKESEDASAESSGQDIGALKKAGPPSAEPMSLDTSVPLLKAMIKSSRKQPRFTRSQIMGTYQYFSPEAAMGLPGSGIGADLWAVSLTALECFLGRRLWEMGSTAGQALEDFLTKLKPEPKVPIPAQLIPFFQKALAKERSERHQSAKEMEEELSQLYLEINERPYARPAASARPESTDRLKMKAAALQAIRERMENERE